MVTRRHCQKRRCNEPMFMGGLCRGHHERSIDEDRREQEALSTLHCTSGAYVFYDELLCTEFRRLKAKWIDACDAVIRGRGKPCMPYDEAEDAVHWCKTLARELILADKCKKEGKRDESALDDTRIWAWRRLENLEKGLMSNGLPRRSP